MAANLEETLISVWHQAMVEDAKVLTLGDEKFPAENQPIQIAGGGF